MTIDNTHGHHWPSTLTPDMTFIKAKEKDLEASLDPYKVAILQRKALCHQVSKH